MFFNFIATLNDNRKMLQINISQGYLRYDWKNYIKTWVPLFIGQNCSWYEPDPRKFR